MHNTLSLIFAAGLFSAAGYAATVDVATVNFDIANPPLGQVDIVNQTGANSSPFPDTTFPVTTPVSLVG